MIIIYTTIKEQKDAQKLINEAIDLKLAACADSWPIQSTFFWNGKKISPNQYMIMFTTHNVQAHDLEKHIIANHPYSTPLVARVQVDMVNDAYQLWVNETLGM